MVDKEIVGQLCLELSELGPDRFQQHFIFFQLPEVPQEKAPRQVLGIGGEGIARAGCAELNLFQPALPATFLREEHSDLVNPVLFLLYQGTMGRGRTGEFKAKHHRAPPSLLHFLSSGFPQD